MSTPLLHIVGFDLASILPESILAAGGMVVLVSGSLLRKRANAFLASISLAFLGGAAVTAAINVGTARAAFDGTVALDGFAVFFKMFLVATAAISVLVAHHFLDAEGTPGAEFYALVLFVTTGMMLMASATDLILIFLALETFSLGLYVLVAFRRARLDSQEGALKYFLTGSFSSAFFLYGTALMYGAVGSTRLGPIASAIKAGVADRSLVYPAIALLIVGLAFKIAAVPFHMWTPDAYQGAPSPVTGFMAAGSKTAGFAALLRILLMTLPSLTFQWRPIVMAMAVVSMALGSLVAISQSNIKRMLGYSAIAHSGFLLIGVASSNSRGVSGSLFYLAAYSFTIVAAFAVVYTVAGHGEKHTSIQDFKGLWYRQPFIAILFALLLVSLAGIPPTAGFWAKFEVFSAAISAGQVPLVVVGVLASAVAAVFYLRVIVLMFLEDPADWTPSTQMQTAPAAGFAMIIAAAVVVGLGVYPTPLLDMARLSTFLIH